MKDLLDAVDLVCPATVSTNTEVTPCLHLRNLSAHKVSALHMEETMVELWALVSSLGGTCGGWQLNLIGNRYGNCSVCHSALRLLPLTLGPEKAARQD